MSFLSYDVTFVSATRTVVFSGVTDEVDVCVLREKIAAALEDRKTSSATDENTASVKLTTADDEAPTSQQQLVETTEKSADSLDVEQPPQDDVKSEETLEKPDESLNGAEATSSAEKPASETGDTSVKVEEETVVEADAKEEPMESDAAVDVAAGAAAGETSETAAAVVDAVKSETDLKETASGTTTSAPLASTQTAAASTPAAAAVADSKNSSSSSSSSKMTSSPRLFARVVDANTDLKW